MALSRKQKMLILVGGGLERLLILLRMLATSRVEVLISTWVLLLWLAGSRPRLRGYHPLKRFLGRDISRKHALWLGVVTREHTALTAFELLTIDLLFLCQDVGSFLCTRSNLDLPVLEFALGSSCLSQLGRFLPLPLGLFNRTFLLRKRR
jgi:hypothetical protein